jgi:poly(hydroxyalkanoate) depolymerase family esterase
MGDCCTAPFGRQRIVPICYRVTLFSNLNLLGARAARAAADALSRQQKGGPPLSGLARQLPAGPAISAVLDQILARAAPPAPAPEPEASPSPGQLIRATYAGGAGSRPYLLFVPERRAAAPALIVMLHGCTQTAEDFAVGTRMNTLAAAAGALVLYPIQVQAANAQRCWNWFQPDGQVRAGGEAALLAGMTREVAARHGADPARMFAAGLSAGGAQAAILGATYPDLFAAVGVHSGLACGAATDMAGAFMAMRQGRRGPGQHRMRTIIFHGDRDTTVNVRNADEVAGQVLDPSFTPIETVRGQVPGGLAWTRTRQRDTTGRPALERWIVHGGGHAWFGGSAAGSFTEPRGPDASQAMLAFFGV